MTCDRQLPAPPIKRGARRWLDLHPILSFLPFSTFVAMSNPYVSPFPCPRLKLSLFPRSRERVADLDCSPATHSSISRSTTSPRVASSSSSTTTSSPRRPVTSVSLPPARTGSDTRDLVSTVSSPTSCSRVVTSPGYVATLLFRTWAISDDFCRATALAESPSTARSSRVRRYMRACADCDDLI